MKINEIAINEGIEKLGKYVFNTAKNAWELANDTKALSKGGVKSADNLVSPEELSALRRDPVPPSSGPAVWRNPSTGEVSNVPPAGGGRIPPRPTGPGVTIDQLRTPTNGPAAMNIDSAKRAAQASAQRRAAAPKSAETPAAKPAETPAPKPAETPVDDLAKEIKPGADKSKAPGGREEPSMGSPAAAPGVHPDWSKPPPAAAPPVIHINTGKESGFPWIKSALGAAVVPPLYNLVTPKDWPKLPDSVANWPLNAANTVWKNFKDNTGVPTVTSVTPADTTVSPGEVTPPPSTDTVNNAIKNDPANQAVTQEIDDWNKKHPDNPIKESYTNELNRMVYLSRL